MHCTRNGIVDTQASTCATAALAGADGTLTANAKSYHHDSNFDLQNFYHGFMHRNNCYKDRSCDSILFKGKPDKQSQHLCKQTCSVNTPKCQLVQGHSADSIVARARRKSLEYSEINMHALRKQLTDTAEEQLKRFEKQRCEEWRILNFSPQRHKGHFRQPPFYCGKEREKGAKGLQVFQRMNTMKRGLRDWLEKCASWKWRNHEARTTWLKEFRKNKKVVQKFEIAPDQPPPYNSEKYGDHYKCLPGLMPSFFLPPGKTAVAFKFPDELKGLEIVDSDGWLNHANWNKNTSTYMAKCAVEDIGFSSMGYQPLSKLCRHMRGGLTWPKTDGQTDMDIKFHVKAQGKEDPVEIVIKWNRTHYGSTVAMLPHTKYTYAQMCNTLTFGHNVNEVLSKVESFLEASSRLRVKSSASVTQKTIDHAAIKGPECASIPSNQVFLGVSRSDDDVFFDCHSSPNLCKCLVWLGEGRAKVTYSDTVETLTLTGTSGMVEYELGSAARRRRLLGGKRLDGTSGDVAYEFPGERRRRLLARGAGRS